MTRILNYVWAFPVSAIGLAFALVATMTGGEVVCRSSVIEVSGGLIARLLKGGRLFKGGAAMTLGHVVLARNVDCLNKSRNHEFKHVRQFERWGPLLLPMYWSISAWLRLRGFDPYLDNPFEQ